MPECALPSKPYKLAIFVGSNPTVRVKRIAGGTELSFTDANGICKVKRAYARTFFYLN